MPHRVHVRGHMRVVRGGRRRVVHRRHAMRGGSKTMWGSGLLRDRLLPSMTMAINSIHRRLI